MEQPDPIVHRHGDYPVGELGEEGGEPQQEGLAARGAFGAHHEVAVGQLGLYAGGVGAAVAAEADGGDRGEDLGESGDGVGDGGDLASEDRGEDDGVHEGAVGAGEEDAGAASCGGRRGAAADDDGAAKDADYVGDEAHREEEADGDADGGDEDADGEVEEDEEGGGGSRSAGEATVVEDDGDRTACRRDADELSVVGEGRSVMFLFRIFTENFTLTRLVTMEIYHRKLYPFIFHAIQIHINIFKKSLSLLAQRYK